MRLRNLIKKIVLGTRSLCRPSVAYCANPKTLRASMLLLFRLTPPVLAPTWMIFLHKRES